MSSQFTGLNSQRDTISKQRFLEHLTTGNYIPFKLKSNAALPVYQLYPIGPEASKSISSAITYESMTSLKQFMMEGKAFPDFDFTDLDGKRYTNASTRGKLLVVKTWFVNCQACIEEFPELNAFVERHKADDNIIFLSLALDSKDEIHRLLEQKAFKYAVVSDQSHFIKDELNLSIYPTHIIIDQMGKVVKVGNIASEMISFFENEFQSAD